MTSNEGPNSTREESSGAPILPPNVSIFTPLRPGIAKALLNGRIFTRLTTSAQTSPENLASALRSDEYNAFCLIHHGVILIFDDVDVHNENDGEGDVQDLHHEHFRAVCLALKEKDISLSISGCIYDAKDALGAGFQFDKLSSGSVLVIDLLDGQDDDDSEDEDDEDDDPDGSRDKSHENFEKGQETV